MTADDNGDRLSLRREVLLQARCRKSRWHVFSVELGNVSQGGCSIIGSVANFVVGDVVQLRIAGFQPIDAEVRWIRGDVTGVEFRAAVALAAIDNLAAAYGLPVGD